MKQPIQITGSLKAWTTSKWNNLDSVVNMVSQGEQVEALNALSYLNHDMSGSDDWIEVGVAEITVTLYPREDVVAKELESLKDCLQRVRAENHMRENAILERINNLQAITYEGAD